MCQWNLTDKLSETKNVNLKVDIYYKFFK